MVLLISWQCQDLGVRRQPGLPHETRSRADALIKIMRSAVASRQGSHRHCRHYRSISLHLRESYMSMDLTIVRSNQPAAFALHGFDFGVG